MPIEAGLIKPVVDALLELIGQSKNLRLKRSGSTALREAIHELLQADPNENRAEARIAIAKAAGIISEDVVLAEDMLKKARASKARTAGKSSSGRKRRQTDKPAPKAAANPRRKPAKATPAPRKSRRRPAPVKKVP